MIYETIEPEPQIEWQELSHVAHQDRRSEKRLALVFPIEICGLDAANEFFSERSRTWDVSERGCRFTLRSQVNEGTVLAIRVLHRDSERPVSELVLFQVEWVRPESGRWLVGASSLQDRAVWNLGFPTVS